MRTEPERQSRVSRAATASLIAALAVLIVCILAALFFLPLMGLLGIAMLVGAAIFSLMVVCHYLLWGWWIHRILERDAREED